MKHFQKIFLTLFLIGFLFLFFGFFALAQKVEIEYPQVPGAQPPTTVKTFLPQYIKYLFNLAILIAGLIAFASLVYGGFRWMASAGNPAALADARSQITAGILGLLLLLGSYLILATINPQLTILKVGEITVKKGVILYAGDFNACNAQKENPTGEEGVNFLRVSRTSSSLGDFNDKARSIYFFHGNEELEVTLYSKDVPAYTGDEKKYDYQEANKCYSIPINVRSVSFYWKVPGVYLYAYGNCGEGGETHPDFPDPLPFTDDTDFDAVLKKFHDKAMSLKIFPKVRKFCIAGVDAPPGPCKKFTPEEVAEACKLEKCQVQEVTSKFGAVLHEHSGFKGDAEVFFGGSFNDVSPKCIPLEAGNGGKIQCQQTMDTSYCYEHVNEEFMGNNVPRTSAITVFFQRSPGAPPPTGGVTLYQNYNYNYDVPGEECGPYHPTTPQWIRSPKEPGPGEACNVLDNKTSSIKVEGDYIAVLFRNEGRGQVFKTDNPRLKGQHIGDNAARFLLVIPISP